MPYLVKPLKVPPYLEAVAQKCSVKKLFLEISQNSQDKNLCQSLYFNKVAGLGLQLY